jgi:hypothetical protein
MNVIIVTQEVSSQRRIRILLLCRGGARWLLLPKQGDALGGRSRCQFSKPRTDRRRSKFQHSQNDIIDRQMLQYKNLSLLL